MGIMTCIPVVCQRYDYLRRHCAGILVDRIEDIKRMFPVALV